MAVVEPYSFDPARNLWSKLRCTPKWLSIKDPRLESIFTGDCVGSFGDRRPTTRD